MHEEVLIVDNSTGEQRMVTFDEAAAIACLDRQEMEGQVELHGRCNTIDHTIISTLKAEIIAG